MSRLNIASILFLFSIPLLWLALQFDTALNADHAWLMEAARRFLNGQWMSEAYFDPNPPLSVLLYLPAVFLESAQLIKPEYAHYTITLIFVGLSLPIINNLLKCFDKLDDQSRYLLLFSYICANTVLTSSGELYFGERDQFIFIGLCIFCLYQLLITFKNIYRYEYIFMAQAIVFILLKPHYLIIPALFVAHRLIKTKDIKGSLFTPDMYTLGAVCVGYILVIFTLFPDYVTQILPVFQTSYLATMNDMAMNIGFVFSSMIAASIILALITGLTFEKLKLPLTLFGLAFLSCILFWVQMKGIYYQMIPAIGFWICGLGILLYNTSRHYFGDKPITAPIIMALILLISFALTPPKTALTHSAYQQTPIYKTIQRCAPDCSFYMFADSMDIIHQLSFYSGAKHASRFPVLWWLPQALKDTDGEFSQQFKAQMAEDLKLYKPQYLYIAQDMKVDEQNFDLLDFLTSNSNFKEVMSSYDFSHEIYDNRSNYFLNGAKNQDLPLTFKIYKKTDQLP